VTAAARRTALTAVGVLALDQASKWIVVEAMDLKSRLAVDVLPGFIGLRMAWNRGINFGLGANDGDATRWALAGLAVAISVGLAIWAARRDEPVFATGAGLLIGGALGNAWDRIVYGAVADFLNVTCCGLRNPWAFNVADVAIFAGAAVLAFAPTADERARG
jgi:signal peptidase II